ncbi:MAG TPA: hypothetical protein PLJ71_22610 [Candidatus Hydrogenedentes bacterium]|nr:hypothetical protein [Candidatus Hydrogenedentota bacterium]
MKQRQVAFDDFDMEGFTKAVLDFVGREMSQDVHPSYAIVKVAAPGGVPEFGPEEGRSHFLEELQSGHLLFFPFSSGNVGEPVLCADGQSRELEDDSDFVLGDVDCVGFLLQLRERDLYIDSAVHAGGACPGPVPSVDVENCGVFDAGMEAFLNRFIRR